MADYLDRYLDRRGGKVELISLLPCKVATTVMAKNMRETREQAAADVFNKAVSAGKPDIPFGGNYD